MPRRFETIAKLNPDVILATNAYPLIADNRDKLNAIAPVVGHVELRAPAAWLPFTCEQT